MTIRGVIDGRTIKRNYAQQCADCDYVMPVRPSGRRRVNCLQCHSPELQSVHVTDCPYCGDMVTDADMSSHIEDNH